MVTDLSVVTGTPSLEIKPGHSAPYMLAVTPQERGKQMGDLFNFFSCYMFDVGLCGLLEFDMEVKY